MSFFLAIFSKVGKKFFMILSSIGKPVVTLNVVVIWLSSSETLKLPLQVKINYHPYIKIFHKTIFQSFIR